VGQRNGLKLLDMDECRRDGEEERWREALEEANKRGCVIDLAASDVVVYLIGARSMADVEAISKAGPGYIEGWEFYGIDSLEQHAPRSS